MQARAALALACILLGCLGCLGCGSGPTKAAEPTTGRAPDDVTPANGGSASTALVLDDVRITESSGLARSWSFPGVFYTHNDRGAGPTLFAVDPTGTRAVLTVTGAKALDWEDIASTPDGRLWIADSGDRERTRPSISVSVVSEPAELVSGPVTPTTYQLEYPDGPHDSEALLVDPRSSRVYVVTKDLEHAAIYAAPPVLSSSRTNKLAWVAEAPPNITGGDYAADGTKFALRSYKRAFVYTDLDAEPIAFPLPDQEQGESITFDSAGGALLVGSEGMPSTVLRVPIPTKTEQE